MSTASEKMTVKESLKFLERVAGREGSDTVRLWDSYREQAYLWRALMLLQLPTTVLAIILAFVFYLSKDTIIEVPDNPSPGYYSVDKLPDKLFVSFSRDIVNLISTYQPVNARKQFLKAQTYLWEPALTAFDTEMMDKELRAIEETHRSQMFFVADELVKVERFPDKDYVIVRIPGVRQKLIGTTKLESEEWAYFVKMTTIPRNVDNEYGIIAFDIRIEPVVLDKLTEMDRAEAKSAQFKDKVEGLEGSPVEEREKAK